MFWVLIKNRLPLQTEDIDAWGQKDSQGNQTDEKFDKMKGTLSFLNIPELCSISATGSSV